MVREGQPDARVDVIEDTGHALVIFYREKFNRVLEEVLATLPE